MFHGIWVRLNRITVLPSNRILVLALSVLAVLVMLASNWAWAGNLNKEDIERRFRRPYQVQEKLTSGKIRYDVCFQCLDCVGVYHDDKRCVPIMLHRKKSDRLVPPPEDSLLAVFVLAGKQDFEFVAYSGERERSFRDGER